MAASCEYLFNNVEDGSLVVRVPEFGGSFEIGCHSHILKRLMTSKSYEPRIASLIGERLDPAKDAIDVGANIGLFTVLMAGLTSMPRTVLAIEPTPNAVKYLRRNIAANGHAAKVLVFEGVAAEMRREYTVHTIPGMEEYSSLAGLVHPAVVKKPAEDLSVEGDTLDHLVERFRLNPGLVKIDTEGAEYHVLRGALRTIEKFRPVIISECANLLLRRQGASSQMVVDFLVSQSYVVESLSDDDILAYPK